MHGELTASWSWRGERCRSQAAEVGLGRVGVGLNHRKSPQTRCHPSESWDPTRRSASGRWSQLSLG